MNYKFKIRKQTTKAACGDNLQQGIKCYDEYFEKWNKNLKYNEQLTSEITYISHFS